MAKLERIYNVPLRRGFSTVPRYKRAKKATKVLREFLAKHMKVPLENVRIGRNLNLKVWERGIKNPPHHVKVTVTKEDDDIARAELFGFKYEELTKEDIEKLAEKEEKKAKKTEEKTEKKETKKEENEETSKPKPKKEAEKPSEEPKSKVAKEEKVVEKKAAPKKVAEKKTETKKATTAKATKKDKPAKKN